ncbi:MAG: kinase [Desulfurococcus sp.]|nr:kinase [Desulfurococcus sp.]
MKKILVPLHVSGLWIPFKSRDLVETGSYGAGLNLDLYVEAYAEIGECGIYLNNMRVLEEQSGRICRDSGLSILVRAQSPVGLGKGFGVSASLLIAHALAAFHARRLPSLKALQEAHVVEVEYSTGLGDVLSEYTGGFALRLKPGAPGIGLAHRVLLHEKPLLVVAELPWSEPTGRMLSRISSGLYEEAYTFFRRVVETEDLADFFHYSQVFTRRIFDYKPVDDLLKKARGVISYYLKKAALIVWVERESASNVVELLEERGLKVFKSTISDRGVTVDNTSESPEKGKPAYKGKTG